MNLAKAELKMLVAKNFGKELFEQIERAKAQIEQFRGALIACNQAEKAINAITQLISQDAKDGKIEIEVGDSMEIAKYAVGKLMVASRKIHDLGENAASSTLRAEGVVSGLEMAAKQARSMFNEEAGKVAALRQALDAGTATEGDEDVSLVAGPGAQRVPGMHPGLPMKAQRQAEDDDVKRVDTGNGTSGAAKAALPMRTASKKKTTKKSKKRPTKKADATNT